MALEAEASCKKGELIERVGGRQWLSGRPLLFISQPPEVRNSMLQDIPWLIVYATFETVSQPLMSCMFPLAGRRDGICQEVGVTSEEVGVVSTAFTRLVHQDSK
jgi:hypothetical protein